MAKKIITLAVSSVDSGINWSVKLSDSGFNPDGGFEADAAIINQKAVYVYPVTPTAAQLGLTGVSTYIFQVASFGTPIKTFGGEYATFRSLDLADQFLTSGTSMDIFSNLFVSNLNINMTWNNMTVAGIGSGNTYSLNSNKHSLVYYYDTNSPVVRAQWAPCWSKGGTLTVTAV